MSGRQPEGVGGGETDNRRLYLIDKITLTD